MPTYIYRYEVVESDYDKVPVGTLLGDARRELVHTWTVMNFETGEDRSFTGERRERQCSECYVMKVSNLYGHDGEHGKVYEQPIKVTLTYEQLNALQSLLGLIHYDDLALNWLTILPLALRPKEMTGLKGA